MTKENYKDAIMRMYNFCISSNHPVQIREQFTRDLDFLAKLAEEHFEEKAETNYEHFKDEIIQNVKYALAVVNGEPKPCADTNCDECEFKESGKCVERVIEWLNKQHKKPTYKLTQFEYDLINTYRHVDDRCKFNGCYQLRSLKEKGYFNDVDKNELIKDILENCEVVEDRKEEKK